MIKKFKNKEINNSILTFYFTKHFELSYSVCGYFSNKPRITISLLFFTLILKIPFRNKWTDECDPPKYGIAIHHNSFWIYMGGKGNWGGNKSKAWDFPFITKNWYRTSILLKDDTWVHEKRGSNKDFWHEKWNDLKKIWNYDFLDKTDNTLIPTKIHVTEREWRPKWLEWTNLFSKVRRSIEVEFSEEVGSRKGSWKGGTIGCGYDMLPNENPIDTIKRMEKERSF